MKRMCMYTKFHTCYLKLTKLTKFSDTLYLATLYLTKLLHKFSDSTNLLIDVINQPCILMV